MALRRLKVSVPDVELAVVRRTHRHDKWQAFGCAFLLVAIPSFLAISMIAGFVIDSGYRIAIPISIICGSAFALMIDRGERKHDLDVAADLRDGFAEQIDIIVENGFPVSPRGSWPAILLGAGDQSILCFGGWWEPIRSPHIQWSGLGKEGFPSSHMRIRILPRSGRVLAVETLGEKLPGDFEFLDDATIAPLLAGNHSGFMECQILEGPIEKWIIPSDHESTTTGSENPG